MRIWPLQDAKARFSELLDACLKVVSRRGAEAAVPVPIEQWQRLQHAARPTLKALLLAETSRGDIPVPPRGRSHRRSPPRFD
jgi:prevent-host-death family protein